MKELKEQFKNYEYGQSIRLDHKSTTLIQLERDYSIKGNYALVTDGYYDQYDKRFLYSVVFDGKYNPRVIIELTESQINLIAYKPQSHPKTSIFK